MRIVLLAASVICLFSSSAGGYFFTVSGNEAYCFGEELGYDMVVHGTYEALQEEKTLLHVTVTHQDDYASWENEAKHKERVTMVDKEGNKGSFGFTTESQGEYLICFQNKKVGVKEEVEVRMDIKVGYETKDYAEVARKEHLKPIELELLKLNDEAQEMLKEMTRIRTREDDHRYTSESVNQEVLIWTLISLCIILVLGVYQIFYLRNFFRRKKLIS